MDFKYYDLLSSIIIGYFTMMAYLFAFGIDYNEEYSIAYIAAAYVVGYLINSISSLLEPFWYKSIGGIPSDKLLTIEAGKTYTGISKVRFYEAEKAIQLLKAETGDANASTRKMFACAMRLTNGDSSTRVQDFNAQYAFSRVLLTTIFFVTIAVISTHYGVWQSYLLLIALVICWNRFKERGYYYAREVLNEYLKQKDKNGKI